LGAHNGLTLKWDCDINGIEAEVYTNPNTGAITKVEYNMAKKLKGTQILLDI
jgi:hypothetical protein